MAASRLVPYSLRLKPSASRPPGGLPASVMAPYEDIHALLRGLQELEETWLRRNDRRAVFPSAYVPITEELIRRIADGTFERGAWVEKCAVHFGERYRTAVIAHEHGDKAGMPGAWRVAFDAALHPNGFVLLDLLLGMNAHINHDLPLSLVDVLRNEDPEAHRADYLMVLRALEATIDPVQRALGERYAPGLALLDHALLRLDETLALSGIRFWRTRGWRQAALVARGSDDERDLFARRLDRESTRHAERLASVLRVPSVSRTLARIEQIDVERHPLLRLLPLGTRRDVDVHCDAGTLRIAFQRLVKTSPELLWPHVTDPDLMSVWSRAKVLPVAVGVDGGYASEGALRRVHVPPGITLDEVIELAEPPHRLVYRVVRWGQIGHHTGEMTLTSRGTDTRFRWEVTIAHALSLSAPIAGAILVPELLASLDALERVVCTGAMKAPGERSPRLKRDPEALWQAAERCLDEERILSIALSSVGHPLRWFSHFSVLRLEAALAACRSGRIVRVGWALDAVTSARRSFHRPLYAALEGDEVPEPFRSAFAKTDRAVKALPLRPLLAIWPCLLLELEHVHGEAAREAARRESGGDPSLTRFRADDLALAACTALALESFLTSYPGLPGAFGRALRTALPGETRRALTSLLAAPYARRRRDAFERANRGD